MSQRRSEWASDLGDVAQTVAESGTRLSFIFSLYWLGTRTEAWGDRRDEGNL